MVSSPVLRIAIIFFTCSAVEVLGGGGVVTIPQKTLEHFLIKASKNIVDERPDYSFGNHNPEERLYDCSSFVVEVVKRSGRGHFPRSSRAQFFLMRNSSDVWLSGSRGWKNLKKGDLIFFSGTFNHKHKCPVSHVMIYIGNNLMVGAQPGGVGFFPFFPKEQMGKELDEADGIRIRETVYAYARPNWGKIRETLREKPWILDLP